MGRLTRHTHYNGDPAIEYKGKNYPYWHEQYDALSILAHYEDLEEQGKLVLFPRYAYFVKDMNVHKGWVQEAMYWHSRRPLYDIRYDDDSLANYRGYLGITVFLTKEEAEAKLAELKGE